MYSLKPGRGPSFLGGIACLGVAVFGIFWTIIAYAITKDASFPVVGTVFPLFGVVFVIIGIASAVYNFANATGTKRFSALDVTTGEEEPDPLNEYFGAQGSAATGGSTEARLAKIEELRTKGLITEAEYAEQRRRVLNSV